MNNFFYIYILVREKDPEKHYTGTTQDLEVRLKSHNSGQVLSTTKHRPWKIETTIAFRSKDKTSAFEKYLKSHSGRAFAKRHF